MQERLITIVCLAVAAVLSMAAAPPAIPPTDAPPMPVSEIEAGMTGYGITALGRGRPERFDVEVLGVLRGRAPRSDLVVIRMSGPDEIEVAGGFSGMSGSPVFIDGKWVGAVSAGWTFAKLPFAGVTPAEEMLRVTEITEKQDRTDREARRRQQWERINRGLTAAAELLDPANGPQVDRESVRLTMVRAFVPEALAEFSRRSVLAAGYPSSMEAPVGGKLQTLRIPLTVGGMGSAGQLRNVLRGTGFVAVDAAAGAARPNVPPPTELKPGVPIGVAFVTGDMTLSGMGTLTWQRGDTVLAFGHPMFGLGDVDFPMAIGYGEVVVPSVYNSFRLSNTGAVIGALVQDRDSAVLGRVGASAPTFPMRVRTSGLTDETYNYTVAGYWLTAPTFAFLAAEASTARWVGQGGPLTLHGRSEIRIAGRDEPIVLEDDFAATSVSSPTMQLVMQPLGMLTANPFREVQIREVACDFEVRTGFEAASLERVRAVSAEVAPGQELKLQVDLRLYRGDIVTREVVLRVPNTAKPGNRVQIMVADAQAARAVRRRLDPGFFRPDNLDELIRMLEAGESNRSLVVRAAFVEEGLRYDGQAMPALPAATRAVIMHDTRAGRTTPLITDVVKTLPTPWVISGSQTVEVTIEKPEIGGR